MPVLADNYSYNLASSGNGLTGTGASFTNQGKTITAQGYIGGNQADLFFAVQCP